MQFILQDIFLLQATTHKESMYSKMLKEEQDGIIVQDGTQDIDDPRGWNKIKYSIQ